MEQHAFVLRGIADRLGLKTVRELVVLPNVRDVYRVTIHYPDMRARDTVATIQRDNLSDVTFQVVYQGRFNNEPLRYKWDLERYEAFISAVKPSTFDKLFDQSVVPSYGEDFCLMERGSGGFVKSVIFVPQRADGEYARLMMLIKYFMPEVMREIT